MAKLIKKSELPKFVKLKGTALRLIDDKNDVNYDDAAIYYRDGGNWYVKYKFVDGVLLSDCTYIHTPHLHEIPLIKISKKEWKVNNGQYAPKDI